MCYLSAFESSIADIIPWFEPTPTHKACRRGEHSHVSPCLGYNCGSRTFFDSRYGLNTIILFRKMRFAKSSKFLLAFLQLLLQKGDHASQLFDDSHVRL